MTSPQDDAGTPAHMRLRPLTLTFQDAALEGAFRAHLYARTRTTARFAIVLAILLYLGFGAIDLWIATGAAAGIWVIRAVVLATALGFFAITFHRVFDRRREPLMIVFAVVHAYGLSAIFSTAPGVIDQYYVAYLLLIMAGYTLLSLRFVNATALGLFMVLLYAFADRIVRTAHETHFINNLAFLVSALIIAGIGGYVSERYRRLSFAQRLEIEHEQAMVEYIALHDPLTNLANRRLLLERLSQALARAKREDRIVVLFFLDLDGFKAINDKYGHATGDELLREVARRLSDCLREVDTVARLGGDEFVVLGEGLDDLAHVKLLLTRIESAFAVPAHIGSVEIPIRPSIGAATFPADGDDPAALLDAADAAMYEVKRKRGRARSSD